MILAVKALDVAMAINVLVGVIMVNVASVLCLLLKSASVVKKRSNFLVLKNLHAISSAKNVVIVVFISAKKCAVMEIVQAVIKYVDGRCNVNAINVSLFATVGNVFHASCNLRYHASAEVLKYL